MEQIKIAVLYFSRSAEAEARIKSWSTSPNNKKNLSVAKFLTSRTKNIVESTNLQVFYFDEKNQIGENFGEKLAHANADIFAKGFDAVISVGNDCLEIDQIDWKEICSELKVGRCIVGPSLRQGTYLIGMTKTAFHNDLFSNLPWQTQNLKDSLVEYFEAQSLEPIILQYFRDLNNLNDLIKNARSLSLNASVRAILSNLISAFNIQNYTSEVIYFSQFANNAFLLRGPPSRTF